MQLFFQKSHPVVIDNKDRISPHRLMLVKSILLLVATGCSISSWSQITIRGQVVDAAHRHGLAYVNVGIKEKNIGSASQVNGSFTLLIPTEFAADTITFSLVGYHELNIPLREIDPSQSITIRLIEKITTLDEVVISEQKLVQRKYGIKTRGLIHFTDGIFKADDSFEIGQVIRLGEKTVQITSVNLHINATRGDSASFRINFYRYDNKNNRPKERIFEKSILQRHPVKEGWLTFELSKYNILLKGKVFAAIEFIPEHKKDDLKQILYEVKIGGRSGSFFRRNSLGQWTSPPHHYCLYVTALVDNNTPDEPDDVESVPAITLQSDIAPEPFSVFVRLPKGYERDVLRRYPVIYHLDGNAFFDPISGSVERLVNKKKITDAIVVGIGYDNAYAMDSLRKRDYTFPEAPPADSFKISGGGERFYRFIKMELQPYITRTYRTDTLNRIIMGHSLGGYFVLYSLLADMQGDPAFDHYVAASPSLWYNNFYVVERFKNLMGPETKKRQVYLSRGELESAEDPQNKFTDFGQVLLDNERL
ncbi:MAG TPA: alpha/beta hydrolase-fold protein, partial [Chryseolinea sp.]|nr:alpha/beta hydrolase-fold protein [Chryseolinea sp.]